MHMIYSAGNAAKQWIFQEIHRRFGDRPARILDVACGSGTLWKTFLEDHPTIHVTGVDTDRGAIDTGKSAMASLPNIELAVFDAQRPVEGLFDCVTALSALEHIVDHAAFIDTVWQSLRQGGVAFLNYDAGHFRSRNIKERIMVPVSQMLAVVGIEWPYMKKVEDAELISLLERRGFVIIRHMKHNAPCLKRGMKPLGEDAVRRWLEFESSLNDVVRPEDLDRLMLSTTIVVQKPASEPAEL